MGRPRAGHGWTTILVGKKFVALMANADGKWITTGEARGWIRCQRCRKPEEHPQEVNGRKLCIHCYYYKSLPDADMFWKHQRDYLFPYNIGRRAMNSISLDSVRKARDWKAALRALR